MSISFLGFMSNCCYEAVVLTAKVRVCFYNKKLVGFNSATVSLVHIYYIMSKATRLSILINEKFVVFFRRINMVEFPVA